MDLEAVYVGDSANFHRFQIAHEGVVGSIYIPKKAGDVDDRDVYLELITPGSDIEGWKERMDLLIAIASPKAKTKYQRVRDQY